MRMVELFTTGPARVLGTQRAHRGKRAGRSHDFFHRTRHGLFARRNPPANRATRRSMAAISRRADGDDRRRTHRLPTVEATDAHRSARLSRTEQNRSRNISRSSRISPVSVLICGSDLSRARVRRRGACRAGELRGCRARAVPGGCGRNDRAGRGPCRWKIPSRLLWSRRLLPAARLRAAGGRRPVARRWPRQTCIPSRACFHVLT